ncbi:MAG TPA: GTPase (G3E family) [Candidatus Anaerobutyricum faecale]|nr:GTPase (G3E family) [Candidatus Anaerobutyricum faecale]
MIKVDLITGFLGAGKTTFIKKYAKYLMDQGCNIGILENDYGAVNVDMMLLQELQGERCDLSMVAGGCDADCHRRRFKTKLIAMGMSGYDRVLIEPSGIFDVDEFYDVLYEEPLCRWYETGNVIAIVDGGLEEQLSEQSEFLLASQIAGAGKVLLSKTSECAEAEIEKTVRHMNRAMEEVQCERRFQDDVIRKDWDSLTDEDWKNIANSGYVHASYVKKLTEEDSAYSTQYYLDIHLPEQAAKQLIGQVMNDPSCGNIFRIKGFLKRSSSAEPSSPAESSAAAENAAPGWLEINATRRNIRLEPIKKGQEVLIVIGENLNKERLDTYFGKYL